MQRDRNAYRLELRLSRPDDPYYPPLFVSAELVPVAADSYEDFLVDVQEALEAVYHTLASERGKSSEDILRAVLDGEGRD